MISEFKGKYSFLSNFYPIDLRIGDRVWKSVEHYYQAMKCVPFEYQEYIRSLETPAEAKRDGKLACLREDWEYIKETVMWRALKVKFSNIFLRRRLLETEGRMLIEGNFWHDTYWGRCGCKRCKGEGENRLGILLMKLREEIRRGQ